MKLIECDKCKSQFRSDKIEDNMSEVVIKSRTGFNTVNSKQFLCLDLCSNCVNKFLVECGRVKVSNEE